MQGISARSSKQSRGNTPVFQNHYIDLEPGEPYYGDEIQLEQHSPQDFSSNAKFEDEISRKFVLVAKKKGISIAKSKKSNRNGSKIWSRRSSYQCEDQLESVENPTGPG